MQDRPVDSDRPAEIGILEKDRQKLTLGLRGGVLGEPMSTAVGGRKDNALAPAAHPLSMSVKLRELNFTGAIDLPNQWLPPSVV